MNQQRSSGLPFTEEEVAALRKHWPKGSRATLLAELPGRSWSSIQYKAKGLKVRRGRVMPPVMANSWSYAHLAVLREHYETKGPKFVAERIGRKPGTVGMMAHKLGLKVQRQPAAPKPAPRPTPLPAVQATEHNPARKATNTLKPLLVTGAVAKTSPNTPNLNAQKAAVQRVRGQAVAKPADYVSAEMIRALGPNHPARIAYTRAARQGMPAAQQAYHEAMKTAA